MDENTTPATGAEHEIAIALVVDRASDPITGTITLPHELPVAFTGWMQLTQQLSRALDAAR
jgi:hypothetical protein